MIENLLDDSIKLPSPPVIALKILDSVREEDSNFETLAEIIQADPALAAQTLKIANSSLYGVSGQIGSLSQAISLIGTQALKNIALSFVVIDNFQSVPQGSFNIELFWRRAITTAVGAEILNDFLGVKDKNIFVTSLLQDIGLLVIFLSDSSKYTALLDSKRIENRPIYEMEQEFFGVDHAEISYRLLKSWNFPEKMCDTIRNHHKKDTFDDRVTHLLNLADTLSSIYHGTHVNVKSMELHAQLGETFGLNEKEIGDIIDLVGEKSVEIMELFSIPPGDLKPFSQLMHEAKDELGKLNYSYEQIVVELTLAKKKAEQLATELQAANANLRELAFRDSLTKLYNHGYFQEVLESEVNKSIRYGNQLSLLLLDIDFFKQINDTYGHPAGDVVLIEIATLLGQLVRKCDIVARYGGEEFGIILPETGLNSAKVLAQRLRRGIEQKIISYQEQELSVTVSIGLSSSETCKENELSRETLITNSDQALYMAKKMGRNRIEAAQ